MKILEAIFAIVATIVLLVISIVGGIISFVLSVFTQIDLAGNEILMVTIKLVKNTSQTFDVEFRKLESSKPRRVKEYTNL